MNIIIPYIFVIVLGCFLFGIIQKRFPWENPLDIIIAFWLGLGFCALSTFYSVMIMGHYNALMIRGITIISTTILYYFCSLRLKQATALSLQTSHSWIGCMAVLIPMVLFWGLMSIPFFHNVYGDWDAWTFWNYIANFIIQGGSHWHDLFLYGNEAKHPWFLPAWTVFGWTWAGGNFNIFTRLSAQIFAETVLVTVYFGVYQLLGRIIPALLASVWLLSIPVFIGHSVSQYADVIMAGLIALNILMLIRLDQKATRGDMVTLGCLIGLMSFVKDEGLICSIIMFLILLLAMKLDRKHYLSCLVAFVTVGAATLLVKYWIHFAPQDGSKIILTYVMDLGRWYLIGMYFWYLLTDRIYSWIIIIPGILVILRFLGGWDKTASLMARFLMVYLSVFMFFVLIRQNFAIYLADSAYRFIYQLLPLAIILLFYTLFKNHPKRDTIESTQGH